VRQILMLEGAMKVVRECAGVRRGEKVLILTDPERTEVASLVAAAARDSGAEVVIAVITSGKFDGGEPPELVMPAMQAADVIFSILSRSITHSRAVKAALQAGARHLSMTRFEPHHLYRGGIRADFLAQKPVCDEMARRLGEASTARLTSKAGTDLVMSLAGRRGNSHPCVVREPGRHTSIINIEANIAPVEGTAEGTLVIDGSIPNFDIGPVSEPVIMTVRQGRVADIRGGREARRLAQILESANDPNVYLIAQLAIGLNPECREFNGSVGNDHGVYGSVHIGIGTSENLGGQHRASLHFDAAMYAPTLELDGVPVLRDGQVLIDVPQGQSVA